MRAAVEYAALRNAALPTRPDAHRFMTESPAVARPSVTNTRRLTLLTLAAVAMGFFLQLGSYPLFDVDEGAFSQATLEMFQRDDFLSTYLNGEPRYDKPILIYWLQALSVQILGVSELAFRLPSALCASVWALLIYGFARRYYGHATALFAAGSMACSLGVYIIARAATADALLNMLIAASMFAAWRHLESGERTWLYATFAAIGVGFLTKGPVAILIPFAVTLLFCLLRRDWKVWARSVFDWRGLVLFAVIALPWYGIILRKEGWSFVEGFFFKHNVARFGGTLQGHAGSLVYYIPVVLIGTLPFTALLLRALWRVRAAWRDDLQCYLLLWFGFVLLFFSLSGTKLPHYVLYGMSGMFILMAVQTRDLKHRFWSLLPAFLFVLTLSVLPFVVDWVRPRIADPYYCEALSDARNYLGPAYYVSTLLAAALILVFMVYPRARLRESLLASGVVCVLLLSLFVVPLGASLQQAPVKEAAVLARERGYDVIMWRLNTPSFSVYYGRPTVGREPRPGDMVLTKAKRLKELTGLGYQIVYSKHGIVLVRIT
jgi:4-amino-4-deoxy-L-arabinose transferase-like glycosyltransferase